MNRYLTINGTKLYEVVSSLHASLQQDLMLALLTYSATNGEEPSEHKHEALFNETWPKVKECVSWGEVIKETTKDKFLNGFKARYKIFRKVAVSEQTSDIENNEGLKIYNGLSRDKKAQILKHLKK